MVGNVLELLDKIIKINILGFSINRMEKIFEGDFDVRLVSKVEKSNQIADERCSRNS